jgi:hypothetical protein
VSVAGRSPSWTAKCYSLPEWSGINALIYYGPLLMRRLGLNGSTINLLVAGGINIVQFLAVFPAILYIDKWGRWPTGSPFLAIIFWIGRKPLLRGGSAVMTMSHLLSALLVCPLHMLSTISAPIRRSQVFEFGSEWENHSIAAWVAIRYVFSFNMCCDAHKAI